MNVTEELNFKLQHDRIIINSEKVFQDSFLLEPDKDYRLDYASDSIEFTRLIGSVTVEYYIYPSDLLEKFYYYQVQDFTDSTRVKLPPRRRFRLYDDTSLNISGSKTISISFTNNEDFSLDQSLFLQINGKLGENLNIEAQLSDSQSPITPEGDSRELSSLDKVFLRLYGTNYELAFGDLEMEFSETQFMNYSPKFEGLKAGWFGRNSFQGALAISKGKKATVTFNGTEAKQGPYYLSTENAEGLQVIPGTEEVFLNGAKLERGLDYTIDYSEGSVTFTNEHFISTSSYIQVTFQYADENYRQNMYMASSQVKVSDRISIRSNMVIQNDDKNNPLQDTFSETDIEALQQAGDNVAFSNGIVEVEDGLYEYSEEGNYYYYVGNDTTAVGHYNISFTEVGSGNGDYEYNEDGNYYEYIGEGLGSYLPLKKLPSPGSKSNYNLIIDYEGDYYSFSAEGIFSEEDKNSFSNLDDADNNGYAAHVSANVFPDFDKLKPEFKLQFRRIGDNLSLFSDLQNPLDAYEFTQFPDTLASTMYSCNVSMDILNFYQPSITYKNLVAKDYAEQKNWSLSSNIKQKNFIPELYYRYLNWKQDYYEEKRTDQTKQHDINISYQHAQLKVGTEHYNKQNTFETSYDTLNTRQVNNLQRWNYYLETVNTTRYAVNLSYLKEKEKFEQSSILSDEISQTYSLNTMLNIDRHRMQMRISHRKKEDRKRNASDNFNMADISMANTFLKDAVGLNSSYSLKNVEFYPKIKEFQYVGDDMGSYDVDTVYVGFNQGDYEWKVTEIDYDNPDMSVEVNATLNLNLNPKLLTNSFLKKFQSETYLLVSENSTEDEKRKVYLLSPDVLMNSETTIYGRRIIQQTLWYEMIKRKLTSKFKYKQEKTLDNRYVDVSERKDITDWEGTLRLTSLKNANIELVYENRQEEDSRYESSTVLNFYALDMRNRLNDDLTMYSSLQYSQEDGNKSNNSNKYQIIAYKIEESVTYFFKRKYRLYGKASYKRNTRSGSTFLSFLADKKDGDIFKWNLNLDYRISNYTSARLEYSGDSYPDREQIHQLSIEVKAEF
ncbi:MAG: hypothetical protein ISS80_01140 [Candidatus Cloacimonetes bacterium]|nr:hypothetical protein [Candidatus Cloacimonadota bacterium]MBL7148654.1 hypothetical protein [Candidatus Cloacimonadota bacterium]